MSQSVTDCEFRPAELPAHVAVIGLGYIGLPTAVCMATGGLTVTGVDINPAIVEQVRRGNAPFEEPDLAVALSGAVSMGHLSADTKVPAADAFIIAVPTPFTGDRKPDLSFVMTAAESVARVLRGGEMIVLESTVPPGTTERVRELIAAARPDLRLAHPGDAGASEPRDGTLGGRPPGDTRLVHFAHCPERVLPGRIMIEIATNDRVIGGLTPPCAARAAQLYRTFCRGELHLTDATSAEMVKLAENAYRDVNIAFANELALVCGELSLDVSEVISMANRHPRVSILRPGIGVGGHCIAVDPWFIIDVAPRQARLLRLAREVNDGMPGQVARQIVAAAREQHARRIACLGLAFKPDVSDVRNSPAVQIVAAVARALPDAEILAVEPHQAKLPSPLDELGNVRMVAAADALSSADVAVRLVDHSAFRSLGLPGRVGQVS
jgi:UDP-N-acetyl-D-mannosaminuronic acid dehydrogenase